MASPTPPDRRLTRSPGDRLLGGVAAGLATFLGIDPTLVRVGFVVLAVFGGSGIALYLAMWLLVPPADDHERPVDANVRASVGEFRDAAKGLVDNVRTGWRQDDEEVVDELADDLTSSPTQDAPPPSDT